VSVSRPRQILVVPAFPSRGTHGPPQGQIPSNVQEFIKNKNIEASKEQLASTWSKVKHNKQPHEQLIKLTNIN